MKNIFAALLTLILLPCCMKGMEPEQKKPNQNPYQTKPMTGEEKFKKEMREKHPGLVKFLITKGKLCDALLAQAMIFEDDPVKSYEIYTKLSEMKSQEEWHAKALVKKSYALAEGNGVKKDKQAALQCLLECIRTHKNHPKAFLVIADHYEKDTTIPRNYEIAAQFYKKAFEQKEPMGGFQYARLIYNGKIKPETKSEVDDILHYTRPATWANITEALYLLATTLLDNGRDEFVDEGLPALFQAAKNGHAFSALQLGIFFKNGLYVERDMQLAQKLFAKALAMENTPINLLAKAYMHTHGIGVTRDEKLGKQILDECRGSLSDIEHIIANLFSGDDKLGANSTEEVKLTEIADTTATPLGPLSPAAAKNRLAIESPLPVIESPTIKKEAEPQPAIPKQLVYHTVVDKCNALSIPKDGSRIEVDMKNHTIFIHDPQYQNEFICPFEDGEFCWDLNPKPFKYHERVEMWHTKTLKALKGNSETRWRIPTHRFGTAADYAIQLVGIKNPYLSKDKKSQESLVHRAESITQKTKGHFEFTFYGSGDKKILYHRNFKPYKKEMVKKT